MARTIAVSLALLPARATKLRFDLEVVDRKGPQVGQTRPAGAKVVDRHAYAQLDQAVQHLASLVQLFDHCRLGHLQPQP